MKKIIAVILTLCLGASVYMMSNEVNADNEAGSVSDPLVTKSYVDSKIKSLDEILAKITELQEKIGSGDKAKDESKKEDKKPKKEDKISSSYKKRLEEVEKRLAEIEKLSAKLAKDTKPSEKDLQDKSDMGEVIGENGFLNADIYTVLKMEKGQKLILGAGAEFIIRAGSGTAIAGVNGDGLADITAGKDLRAGAEIEKQHLLVASVNDGRGVLITSENSSYLLVKGSYKID